MNKIECKINKHFEGEIGGNKLHNQSLYNQLTYIMAELYIALKDIDIKKENEFITDLIDCTVNLYNGTELNSVEVYDYLYENIMQFRCKNTKNLTELTFILWNDSSTNKYFGYINDRLKSGYYNS